MNAPAVTTTVANDIILTGMVQLSPPTSNTINAPFTAESASTSQFTFGHYVQAATTTVTPSYAFVGSGFWDTATLALEP